MARQVSISDPADLPAILDVIHDSWFDRDGIVFHPDSAELVIRFSRRAVEKGEVVGRKWLLKTIRVPIVKGFLRIHHAKRYRVDDKEHAGPYDINELRYDPTSKRVWITTGIPIDVEAWVRGFEVSAEETDEVIRTEDATSLFANVYYRIA